MRIGTRRSALALAQAGLVADRLEVSEQGGCEIIPIVTRGDRGAPAEDKSRWVQELEDALLDGDIDLAVHSAKDVPGAPADGLALLGSTARAAPEDALCGAGGLDELARGARVGTSSVRRAAQLRAAREDLDVVGVRGNVDTRVRKLQEGGLDAIVLARAGLERLHLDDAIGAVLDPRRFVPAPGQGTLALQARADRTDVAAAVAPISDAATFACLLAERALARSLDADCHTPLGAFAAAVDGGLELRAWVGLPDGSEWVSDELAGEISDPEALGHMVAERLELLGARRILQGARETTVQGT
jgi:hydroxymethylbilane synthase